MTMFRTNPEILHQISVKKERKIIGLMSGTSLDGLDIALCTCRGSGESSQVRLDYFQTLPYSTEVKRRIQSVFSKTLVNMQELCILNPWLGTLHGNMVLECLSKWEIKSSDIDLVASHGQTVFHCPKSLHGLEECPNSTLQIGDGDHIAVITGIITISDFRQKHIAAGGEGAPLAMYGDYLIFSKRGENRIMLNIGGISNITCLYGDLEASKAYATDLGPGNTLIDFFTRKYFNQDYDKDGNIAQGGHVNSDLLSALKDHKFFSLPFPKTTGPELFNLKYVEDAQSLSNTTEVSPTDMVATLTRLTAEVIAESLLKIEGIETFKIYASGGGIHNPVLMKHLQILLPEIGIKFTDELGISGDAKEAVLFAMLANEMVSGGRTNFGGRSVIPSVRMGKISFPG